MIKRRNFLTTTTIAATSASVLGSCRVSNQQPTPTTTNLTQPIVNWRMATSWPRYLDIMFDGLDTICRQVSIMTNGRFTITPYPSGELVPPLEVLDGVADGKVECGHTASYYSLKKSPALAFGCTIPFGMTAEQHNAWLYGGGGLEILNKLAANFGVVAFPAGNSGSQMGGWFRREIQTVADLKGLRFRSTGLGGEVCKRLGMEVKVLPAQDIVKALLEGTVDAVEWIGPYDDATMGLQKAAPYYYYPGWWEPGTGFMVMVNQKAWQALPTEYQIVFRSAATEANLMMLARYNAANGETLERIKLGGTQLLPFSQEILQTARSTALDLYEELSAQDANFQSIYQEWKQFRDRIYKWARISNLSFTQFSYPISLR